MSVSNWRSNIAIAGGLGAVAALLLWFAIAHVLAGGDLLRCKKPNQQPGYTTDNQNPSLQSRAPGQSKAFPQSIYKQLSCDKPETEKQYELCQQWRAAEGAEEQACIARRQFWIGSFLTIFGLIGLLLSINYAAASVATLATSERAILHIIVEGQNIQQLIGNLVAGSHNEAEIRPGQLSVTYCFKNYGRTPARITDMTAGLEHWSLMPEDIQCPPGLYVPFEFYLTEGKTTTVTHCHLREGIDLTAARSIKGGGSSIVFYGRVIYDDIFGKEHEHRFFWRYGGPLDLFSPSYYKDFNKNT
jgi:hypothetical protein